MNLNPPLSYEKSEKEKHEASDPAPAYSTPSSSFQTSFATLSMHMSDKIRLLQFPPTEVDGIRHIIKSTWRKGLQAERPYAGSQEFKLYGNPWYGQSSDAIPARVLMRELLAYLYARGWILHISTDLSKKERDKDTLIFRKQPHPPPASEWIAISFNRYDRLRLIGAEESLIEAFRQLLKGMKRLQDEFWKDQVLNCWEFKIYGTPWWATGEDTMVTRLLVIRMLEVLERQGWSLYASIDQNQGQGEHSSETNSWFCVREKGWVPGSSVFHR